MDTKASSENYMVSYAIDCAAIQLMKQNDFPFQYTFKTQKEQKAYDKKYSAEYRKHSLVVFRTAADYGDDKLSFVINAHSGALQGVFLCFLVSTA